MNEQQPARPFACARLIYDGTNSETVDYTPVDDGAAAHEPVSAKDFGARFDGVTDDTAAIQAYNNYVVAHGQRAHEPVPEGWQAHIHGLTIRNEQLSYELRMLRELLSRLPEDGGSETATPEPSSDGVQSDVQRTIDHLWHGRTTPEQRAKLSTATERADRVRSGSDAAVGRALR